MFVTQLLATIKELDESTVKTRTHIGEMEPLYGKLKIWGAGCLYGTEELTKRAGERLDAKYLREHL